MKNKVMLAICGLLLGSIGLVYSQENPPVPQPTYTMDEPATPKTPWTDRLFTGGGVGLQFGSYTYIGAFPILGYRITPKFSAGIGGTYIYLQDKSSNFSTSLYGGKVFAEYDVYRGIAPHVEYEILNREIFDYSLAKRRRINVNSLLVGVSYTQQIGDNAGIYIMLLYNLLEDVYSPYENPVLRIGFNIGL